MPNREKTWSWCILLCSMLLAVSSTIWAALFETGFIEIVIEGLDQTLERNARLLLSIEHHKNEPDLTEPRVRALHAAAPNEIRRAVEPFGYYRPHIDATLQQRDGRWIARYRIEAGPVLKVEAVTIEVTGDGSSDDAFMQGMPAPSLRQGESLRHAAYEETKRALLDYAVERGYLDARFVTHELRVDLERYVGSARLQLETGPQYRFGDVRFEQDFFDPSFLARYVSFKHGDPYSPAALLDLQAALNDADYFQRVDVQPQRDRARDREIPVSVELEPKPPDKYSFGIGYGTDTGARGKLGWERRLVNPRGHRFGSQVEVSEIGSALTARYLIPVLDPRTDQIAFSAAATREHTLNRISDTSLLGAALNHARGSYWRESLALNYHRERFSAGDDRGQVIMLMPITGWTYTRADDRFHPRHGGRAHVELRGAHDSILSDISFWQLRMDGRYIHPFGAGRMMLRAAGGYTDTSQFERLPATQRFYAGGSQSVRGYRYQSLGPKDDEGKVTGGRYLLEGGVEIDRRLSDTWGAAIFYDIGKAFNDGDEPFSEGAGVGARWRLPIGTARIDVARALTPERRPWRIHFVISADL